MVDIDDYINGLHKEIEHLKNVIESYKKEVAFLRSDYADMKRQRDNALEMLLIEDSTITENN